MTAPSSETTVRYLKVREIVAQLRITKMTVHRMVHDGRLPGAIRVGRSIRVPEASVSALIAQKVSQEPHELRLTPADAQALLDALAADYRTHARQLHARLERLAAGGPLTIRSGQETSR
jgi:excisionase family DNA binding protein